MLKTIALIGLTLPLSLNAAEPTTDQASTLITKTKSAKSAAMPMEPKPRDRRFNLRLQPFNFFLGGLGFDAEIKLFERFSLAGTYSSYDFDVTDSNTNLAFNIKATGYGIRANWYPSGALADSTYISPLIQTASIDIVDGDFSGSTDVTSYGILFGNQWMWDGINLNLAAGYSAMKIDDIVLKTPLGNTKVKNSSDIPAGGLLAEFSIGYAF
ncbi:MAG: autotransporter domain-containing protein [Gammaproteobacteria bacterium]|nr:autotransporter domain-containing protein [Gammaproteobacteria bacterium]